MYSEQVLNYVNNMFNSPNVARHSSTRHAAILKEKEENKSHLS
ncbi:MAG: hypothetical protein ACRC28_00040 [Clostridium sp.]